MSFIDNFDEGFDQGEYASERFGESLEEALQDMRRSRIFLMGCRRSGKSSIQKVVFHKMSPHETLFLESTNNIQVREISRSPLVQLQVYDFPGNFDFADKKNPITPQQIFGHIGVLVFVIDAQEIEMFTESFEYFVQMTKTAYRVNPNIKIDVLIHKVDGDFTTDEHKMETKMDIMHTINEELANARLSQLRPDFHLTSIYDHSIFEAFSQIVHKLIPQFGLLENLLNGLIASCGMDKSFLFDVVSKIYVATDTNPVNMQTYELCSDMIDVVIDVSCIYGLQGKQRDALAYDADSASVIKLDNGSILYLREVNKYLALVCMMREEVYVKSVGLVEYNFSQFKLAIADLFDAQDDTSKEAEAKRR
jgi:Ras-related GTP-binding protein C/D